MFNKSRDNTKTVVGVGGLVGILLICGAIYGYVANIVSLVHHISDPNTAMLVLRAVGIFVAPLGVILGYL